jgi:hypothetical protein
VELCTALAILYTLPVPLYPPLPPVPLTPLPALRFQEAIALLQQAPIPCGCLMSDRIAFVREKMAVLRALANRQRTLPRGVVALAAEE